ncbi:hypothetical protein RRSWK_06864 [Rhodopirellula sp. SWK7]|nr:hypothetical protein RRSWK_06864 [Rhodopirellula sp. SWK7]
MDRTRLPRRAVNALICVIFRFLAGSVMLYLPVKPGSLSACRL